MKAIIYARFSPRPNAVGCVSIETQLERCRAYCLANAYTILGEYTDPELSGARMENRPGLQAALEHACKAKCTVVVYSLSRLARSTQDALRIAERLNKAGAHLSSLHEKIDTTSAAGRLFYTMMSAFSQFERETIAERTSDAMKRHQASGRIMGRRDRPPFGWIVVGDRLVPDETAPKRLLLMKALRAQGMSLRKIAAKCQLSHVTVYELLKRAGVA